jgi:hypothetical protein
MTFSLSWMVSGPATYVTGCTLIVLDERPSRELRLRG